MGQDELESLDASYTATENVAKLIGLLAWYDAIFDVQTKVNPFWANSNFG